MKFRAGSTSILFPFLLMIIILTGCKPRHIHKREIISFKPYFGIKYTEIQRRLTNGLAFNEYGYQLEPEWQLEFLANDSARIFSPTKKTFINFPLSREYDSVFNTARTWYKMRKMNKDSMVLEILRFSGDSIELTGNKVFMTFYANNYIKNVLHSDTAILRRPSRRDTAFIKDLVAKSKQGLKNAFGARHPARVISNSPDITVTKNVTASDLLTHFDVSDDYMYPTYYIAIKKANDNYSYSFSVYVDESGKITFGKPLVSFAFSGEGYRLDYIKKCKELMNGYFKYYLNFKPGNTLGMVHVSEISLHVKGRKENK